MLNKLDWINLNKVIIITSKIQLVAYYQWTILIGWATSRLLAGYIQPSASWAIDSEAIRAWGIIVNYYYYQYYHNLLIILTLCLFNGRSVSAKEEKFMLPMHEAPTYYC